MKIVNIAGPAHREDGPPLFWMQNLNGIPGVTCERKTVLDAVNWDDYDVCLYVDWGQDCFTYPDFRPPAGIVSVCVQSDTHYHPSAFGYRLEQARHYTKVFVNQLSCANEWNTLGVKCDWLPHAGEHTCYTPLLKDWNGVHGVPPDPEWFAKKMLSRVAQYDVGFVGFIGDEGRRQFLDEYFRGVREPYFNCNVFLERCSDAYNRCAMVVNKSIRGELNMRTFEAMCARNCLITDRQEGMRELGLRDGIECLMYDSVAEAIEKTRWYLNHQSARERIAECGWRWVLSGHTYWHRARKLVDVIKSL